MNPKNASKKLVVELAEIRRQNGIFTPMADLVYDISQGYPPFRTPTLRVVETLSEIMEFFRPVDVCYEPRTGRVCASFQ